MAGDCDDHGPRNRACSGTHRPGDPTLGETTWITVGQVSRQRFTVTGLVPYKTYWFRIIAMGIDKEGLPSDVVLGRPA